MSSPPPRELTLQCETCDATFNSELELFDHNLTWNHRVQVDTTRDRRLQVSPPIYSSRDQSTTNHHRRRKRSRRVHHSHSGHPSSHPPALYPRDPAFELPSHFPPHALRRDYPYPDPRLEYSGYMSNHDSGPPPPPSHSDYVNGQPYRFMPEPGAHHSHSSSRNYSSSSVESNESAKSLEGFRQPASVDQSYSISHPKKRRKHGHVSSSQGHKSSRAAQKPSRHHKKEIVHSTQLTLQPPEKPIHKRPSGHGSGSTHSSREGHLRQLQEVSRDSVSSSGRHESSSELYHTAVDMSLGSVQSKRADQSTVDLATPTSDVTMPTLDMDTPIIDVDTPIVGVAVPTAKGTDDTSSLPAHSTKQDKPRTSSPTHPTPMGPATEESEQSGTSTLTGPPPSIQSVRTDSTAVTKSSSDSSGLQSTTTVESRVQHSACDLNNSEPSDSGSPLNPAKQQARTTKLSSPSSKKQSSLRVWKNPFPKRSRTKAHKKSLPSGKLPAVPLIEVEPRPQIQSDDQSSCVRPHLASPLSSNKCITTPISSPSAAVALNLSVLQNLTRSVFSAATSLHLSTPSQTPPISSPPIVNSLLSPLILLHLSGVSRPTSDGGTAPGNRDASTTERSNNKRTVSKSPTDLSPSNKTTKSTFTLPTRSTAETMACSSVAPDGSPLLRAGDLTTDTGVRIKTEPEDFSYDPPHTNPPPTAQLPARTTVTTVCDSRDKPISFGDTRHLDPRVTIKQEPDLSMEQESDLTPLSASLLKSPTTNSLPRQPEIITAASPLTAEHMQTSLPPSGAKDSCVSPTERETEVCAKRPLDNGSEEETSSKRARSVEDGDSSFSNVLSQISVLDDQEKSIKVELFALRKRKGEVAAVRKERQVQVNELQQESLAHKTECEELKKRLEQLQNKLKSALEVFQEKSSALTEKENELRESEDLWSELTTREQYLTQSFSDVLKKKTELVLSSDSNPTSDTPPPTHSDKPPATTAVHSVASAISSSNRITSTPIESTRQLPTSIGLSTIQSNKSHSLKTVETPTVGSSAQPLMVSSDGEASSLPSLEEHLEQIETPRCAFEKTSYSTITDTSSVILVSESPSVEFQNVSGPKCTQPLGKKRSSSQGERREIPRCVPSKTVASTDLSTSSVVVLGDSPVTMVTKSEHAPSKKRSSSQSDSEANPASSNSLLSNVRKQSSLTNGAANDEGQIVTYTPHKQSILCLKAHDDYLFSGSSDASVLVHNSHTGELLHRLIRRHEKAINCIAVYETKGTLYLVTGSNDKNVNVYSVGRWKQVAQFSLGEPVTSVAVAGDLLFIALLTGSVRVVDLVTKKQLLSAQSCHKARISHLCLLDHFLITGSFDKSVCVWDTREAIANKSDLTLVRSISLPDTPLCIKVQEEYMCVGCGDGNVYIYRTEDWSSVGTLPHNQAVSCLFMTGGVLVTGCFDKVVRCYDIKTLELLQQYYFESRVFCVCALKRKINVGLEDGSLKAVTLDLVNFHVCRWNGCGLKFGVLTDLTTYHLKEHVDPNEKLPAICQWEGCDHRLNPSELLAHLEKHAKSKTGIVEDLSSSSSS